MGRARRAFELPAGIFSGISLGVSARLRRQSPRSGVRQHITMLRPSTGEQFRGQFNGRELTSLTGYCPRSFATCRAMPVCFKKGDMSPGVQRQYTGSAGKTTNYQIGVSLTVATRTTELPVDMDLYLPESWAKDRKRCRAAHIPLNAATQAPHPNTTCCRLFPRV